VIGGFPMIDFKAVLIDGAYSDARSTPLAFDKAARACYREAIPTAGPKLLEPIMLAEVETPAECMGDIINDLNRRRGRVGRMERRGDTRVICVMVPLANMLGYAQSLESLSHGRAVFIMRFSHYEAVPTPHDPPFGPAVGMRA